MSAHIGAEAAKLLIPEVAGKLSGAYVAGALHVQQEHERLIDRVAAAKTPSERAAAQKALKLHIHSLRRDLRKNEAEAEGANKEVARLKAQQAKMEPLVCWLEAPMRLQECAASRLHELRIAIRKGRLEAPPETKNWSVDFWQQEFDSPPHTFLVQQDWAHLFAEATEYEGGEFRLPYDTCCFEFCISGTHLILHAAETTDAGIHVAAFVKLNAPEWFQLFSCPFDEIDRATEFVAPIVSAQLRAICIGLEAEVAASEVIRASYSGNRARAKQGLPPLLDHRVISLAKRSRALPGAGGDTHRSPRLHFRRGHWRHFATHKTWIKWMLVGNPDLGFVSKTYRA